MTPETLYVELRILYTKTEQEFLRLAVQAVSKNIVNLVQARRTKHSKYAARDLSLEKGKWDRLQIVSGKEMAVCVSG